MKSLDHVSDSVMAVGFPERDFDGYALFGALEGHDSFRAIKLIVFLGGLDGFDWGMARIPPDPTFSFWEITLIGDSESRRHFKTVDRSEFRAAREHLDVVLPGRVQLSGSWPSWEWEMSMPDEGVTVALTAKASSVYWSPNLVHKGTSWMTCAFADFTYEGLLTLDGTTTKVKGVGTFDHPFGVVRPTLRSPGVGFWEWDSFMINGEQGLFAWFAVDGNGKTIVADVVTTFPDGRSHVGQLDFEYTDFEDWNGIMVPRDWRCSAKVDHGELAYSVHAELEKPPGGWAPGDALPNPLLVLSGVFNGRDGSSIPLQGYGTGESIQALIDPKTGNSKLPW
jgi:hypothetical protein